MRACAPSACTATRRRATRRRAGAQHAGAQARRHGAVTFQLDPPALTLDGFPTLVGFMLWCPLLF